jgi:hypothetical protein
VRKNKGSPGIDGMTVEELGDHLRENWRGCASVVLQPVSTGDDQQR